MFRGNDLSDITAGAGCFFASIMIMIAVVVAAAFGIGYWVGS